MDLNQIRALVAVANTGSLKAAAASLDLPRGTVRRRIDALEASLGVELLLRDGRGAVLTDVGRAIVEKGRRLLDDAAKLREIASGTHEPGGTIHLCAPVGMPPDAHVQIATFFRTNLPEISGRTHIVENPVDEPRSKYDVIFHFGPVDFGSEWIQVPLAEVPERLYASRAYIDAFGMPESVSELGGHRLMAWRAPGASAERLTTRAGEVLPFRVAHTGPSIFLIFHQIAAGNGIGLVPDGNVPTLGVDMNDLVEVLPGKLGTTHKLFVSLRRSLEHHPGVKAFWDQAILLARASGLQIE